MSTPLITLTTDFGDGSPYVAQMKGVALTLNPTLTIVDITHSIAPQDVRHGAIVLADATCHFPPATIHICVIDPGVGTERKTVYAEIGAQRFIAPDNGLLSLVARDQPIGQMVSLESPQYWRTPVSATFHGRDIMTPVAVHLTLGIEPSQLGPSHPNLKQLHWPPVACTPHSLVGSVECIDHFGNLITNITRAMLPTQVAESALLVDCGSFRGITMVHAYGYAQSGTVVALFGSSDRLEIAVTNANAAATLGCGIGQRVQVQWP